VIPFIVLTDSITSGEKNTAVIAVLPSCEARGYEEGMILVIEGTWAQCSPSVVQSGFIMLHLFQLRIKLPQNFSLQPAFFSLFHLLPPSTQ